MNKEQEAWIEFIKEQNLEGSPAFVKYRAWKIWRRAFDTGYRLARAIDTPDSEDARYVPKSDGTVAGREKSEKDGGLAELAFGMAAIALTIGGVVLVTIIVQSLSQGG